MTYYIIGIRRSGIHAIANWLFPMMGQFIYLNDYEPGKLTDIEMVISGEFNVLIGIEDKQVDEIMKYCVNGKRIWVRRDLEEVQRSRSAWYSRVLDEVAVTEKIALAEKLDSEYRGVLIQGNETAIHYNAWNVSEGYRREIAKDLNLQFDDSNKEKVFGYGISSF